MTDLTPIERKLLIEALDIAEKHHNGRDHIASAAALRNLRSRLANNPLVVISYRHAATRPEAA